MIDQRRAWDQAAAHYQQAIAEPRSLVHYGPWVPAEAELQLLGDVRGLAILELGCGGGQCAVAFAQQGAQVTGVDVSAAQLHYAQERAAAAGVAVTFVAASAANLVGFADGAWDLVFAVYALPYVTPLEQCLAECWRVLRPGGRLVFSLDHPVRDCFFDAQEQELVLYPVHDYFDSSPRRWRFPGGNVAMENAHLTLGGWIDALHGANLRLVRLVEPPLLPEVAQALWPVDHPLFPIRNLPQTVIFIAQKLPPVAWNR